MHCYPRILTDDAVTARFNEFPASLSNLNVSRGGGNKINCFPRDQLLSAYCFTNHNINSV